MNYSIILFHRSRHLNNGDGAITHTANTLETKLPFLVCLSQNLKQV